ncbi:DNRLRE domain-containing protein [Larkinella soli]|uniref:DNRLRE domain-containing protein n=1 Tax=Larkinella soli TaxID=1770527 RepID=UPI0013E332ED|nr:DNRLRE domain-containing protein [Larkinella soli]
MNTAFRFAFLAVLLIFQGCKKDHPVTARLVLQPGPEAGQDAILSRVVPDRNQSLHPDLPLSAIFVEGELNINRVAILFDLSSISAKANVKKALLTLYFNPKSVYLASNGATGHYPENAFQIQRITAPWKETIITWNNQPATSSELQVLVPAATSPTQNYTVDVTDLVREMVRNPAANYGFLLKHQNETPYRITFLASSDHPDAELRPKLEVEYEN